MRILFLLLLVCLVPDASASAQASRQICWRGRPRPQCSVMVLTSAGGYVLTGTVSAERLRGIIDWAVLVNVSEHDAVGASFFVSIDDADEFTLGPSVRYRRWMHGHRSLDLALGTPLASSSQDLALSLYGLVKWNFNHWFGVAARPELRRPARQFDPILPRRSRFHLSVGVEFDWIPGLALAAAGGAAFGIVAAALSGID